MTADERLAADIEELAEIGIRAEFLTPYQVRFEDAIDIWPKNRNFHDLQTQKRGRYKRLVPFLRHYFTDGLNVEVKAKCPKCRCEFLAHHP